MEKKNISGVLDTVGKGLTKVIERLGVHDHLCLIYETQEEQFAVVVSFMKIGLERGEKCVYIVDDNTSEAVINEMKTSGIDVQAMVQFGKLAILSKQDAYLQQGYFDPDWMIGFLQRATDEAKAEGFSALRVTGEMTWMLGGDPGTERLLEYEAKLNYFLPQNDALVLCQYNRSRFSPEVIKGVMSTHPLVIYGGMVCRNFYYVQPDDFLNAKQPDKEIDRLLANCRDSEARYLAIIEGQTELICRYLPDGRLSFVNDAYARYYGKERQDLLNQNFIPHIPETELAVVLDRIKGITPDAPTTEFEHRVIMLDGAVRWQHWVHRGIFSSKAELIEHQAVGCDITERKQADEHLRILAELIDIAPASITVHDPEGNYLYVNQTACDLHGYLREELLALNIHDLDIPEDERLFDHRITQILETGTASFEVSHYRKDRSIMPLQLFAKRMEWGEKKVILSVASDITERKQVEDALKESEKKFRIVADYACSWEVWQDSGGSYLYCSPSCKRLTGYSSEAFMADSGLLERLIHPDDLDRWKAHYAFVHDDPGEQEAGTGPENEIDFRIFLADSEVRWIGHLCYHIHDAKGHDLGHRISNRDITESKKAEENLLRTMKELKDVNAELAQFNYAVAHDLKAPIRAISNYSAFLEEDLGSVASDETKKYLSQLRQSAVEAGILIEDLLDLAKIGNSEMEPVAVEMGDFMKKLVSSMNLSPDIEIHFDSEWPTIMSDPHLLRQVFQNLIDNAQKYTVASHKSIEIGCFPAEKESITFFVRDNGIGIGPAFHEKIFGLFERLHGSKEYSGTGAGLAIVKKAVNRLGGTIRFESIEGKGSTFYVILPIVTAG